MTNLIKQVNLEKLGIYAFLAFFVFTPLLAKIRVGEKIFVEPLVPLIAVAAVSLVLAAKRRGGRWGQALRRVIFPNPLSILYLLLMGVLFVAFVYGFFLSGSFSWGDLLRIFKYGLYFLSFPLAIYAGKILGRTRTNSVLVLMVLVGIVTAVVSLGRIFSFMFSGGEIDFWVYSIYNRSVGMLGQFFDPLNLDSGLTGKAAHGTYGLYSTVVLAVCLLIASRFREFSARWITFFTMAAIIFYASILYTLSRGAIVTAGLVFFGWFVWLVKEKKIRAVVFTVAFLAVSSVVLIWTNPQVYQKFSSTIKFLPRPAGQTSTGPSPAKWGDEWDIALDPSSRGRLDRWGMIIDSLKENPSFMVFGVGYSRENLIEFTGVSSTHSLFLDLWARGGIPALLLLVGVWVFLFGTIFRFFFSRDSEVRTFGYLLGAFAVGWLLDNLISGEQFFSDAPMIAFWGVLGLAESLRCRAVAGEAGGRRKVLIALTSAEVGGAPQVVHDLLSHLPKKRDFDFVIAAPRGPFVKRFRSLGYKVHSVPLDRISFKSCNRFFEIAREEEIDLINSHGKGAGIYSRLVGTLLGTPVVHTIHGIHYSKHNPISRNIYFVSEKILSALTTLVINVSKNQEREGLKLGLFQKMKSRVVPNGIEPVTPATPTKPLTFRKKLGLEEGDFAVAMVARFDPPGVQHKGHARFIKLIPGLTESVPNIKVIFAGGGEGERSAKRLARELGVSDHLLFLGERDDVPKILRAVDAFVLPSYHEGLPLSVLEASAAGLPVIGSKVVGIKDAVQAGETGLLVDFDRPDQVIGAFKKLARSPALRRRMGERGREFVKEKFSMDRFVKNTLAAYRETLTDRLGAYRL